MEGGKFDPCFKIAFMDSADKKEFGGGLEIQKIKTAAIGFESAIQNLFIDVGTGNDLSVSVNEVWFFVVLKSLVNSRIRRIGPSDFQSTFPMEFFFMAPVAATVLKQGFDCAGVVIGDGPDQHVVSFLVLLIESFDGNKCQGCKCSCGIVFLVVKVLFVMLIGMKYSCPLFFTTA